MSDRALLELLSTLILIQSGLQFLIWLSKRGKS